MTVLFYSLMAISMSGIFSTGINCCVCFLDSSQIVIVCETLLLPLMHILAKRIILDSVKASTEVIWHKRNDGDGWSEAAFCFWLGLEMNRLIPDSIGRSWWNCQWCGGFKKCRRKTTGKVSLDFPSTKMNGFINDQKH